MAKQKILIVDDEKPTRDAMSRALGRSYECLTAPDAELAIKAIGSNPDLALVITDYKMPGDNGIEFIRKAKAANPALGTILITAFGEIDLAVKAMKEGADDFLTKPITDLDQLEFRVAQAIRTAPSEKETSECTKPSEGSLADFTGRSPAMEKVYRLIRKVAPTNATVLVEGPSGTGKELVARALHSLSSRAKGPFVAVECAALSKELLESELFGYTPGTFTGGLKDGKAGCFEAANGGTLFLDEIGEIDLDTQVKLLRAIESRAIVRLGSSQAVPVDFRLVTATNKDLLQRVAEGKFREDLYYRLNVIDIRTPALKEHREDIALLVTRFLKEFSAANGGKVTGVEPAALRALENYDWPGNVRQLRNVVEKMVVLASGSKLTLDDVPDEIVVRDSGLVARDSGLVVRGSGLVVRGSGLSAHPMSHEPPTTNHEPRATNHESRTATLAAGEKELILATLERCGGKKAKAAAELGISRRTIHRKLMEWGIR